MESYLLEAETVRVGSAYEEFLQEYPRFIDGYIQYWKYLKFRLTERQKYGERSLKIADEKGNNLLEKMRSVVETALYFSDCTEIPTSLWVDARVCFAKQLVMDRDIAKAIDILRDLCYILPPFPIEDLSYIQENAVFSKKAGGGGAEVKQQQVTPTDKSDLLKEYENKVTKNLSMRNEALDKL